MKKYFSRLLFLMIPLLCMGCFEIREEVNLKDDGSGEVTVIFDMSRSKGRLKQYMKMEKVENYRVPSEAEIESFLFQIKNTLRLMEGISYAEAKSDWSNFIFKVTARFENIEVLNNAIQSLSEQLKHLELPPVMAANFKYEKGRFSRVFDYPTKPEAFGQLPSMQRYMLESSHAISIYRFEKNVKEMSHKKAIVSPSGKAVMLKIPLSELATGRSTLANSIGFED